MNYEIIDFHTHPFPDVSGNVSNYAGIIPMTPDSALADWKACGVSHVCGSAIVYPMPREEAVWDDIRLLNDRALQMETYYGGFYTPGFHVHPGFVRESCEQIEWMHQNGYRLIGEIVPYMHGWGYAHPGLDEIFKLAEAYGMVVSLHSGTPDEMDAFAERFPNLKLVMAHPGEKAVYLRHIERMKKHPNYLLDVSGTGIFRHGILRYGIDQIGKERFLFGSDYPVCNQAAYIGAVANDPLLTEDEKIAVFSGNAKRILFDK